MGECVARAHTLVIQLRLKPAAAVPTASTRATCSARSRSHVERVGHVLARSGPPHHRPLAKAAATTSTRKPSPFTEHPIPTPSCRTTSHSSLTATAARSALARLHNATPSLPAPSDCLSRAQHAFGTATQPEPPQMCSPPRTGRGDFTEYGSKPSGTPSSACATSRAVSQRRGERVAAVEACVVCSSSFKRSAGAQLGIAKELGRPGGAELALAPPAGRRIRARLPPAQRESSSSVGPSFASSRRTERSRSRTSMTLSCSASAVMATCVVSAG